MVMNGFKAIYVSGLAVTQVLSDAKQFCLEEKTKKWIQSP
jgi:hypothetical protein